QRREPGEAAPVGEGRHHVSIGPPAPEVEVHPAVPSERLEPVVGDRTALAYAFEDPPHPEPGLVRVLLSKEVTVGGEYLECRGGDRSALLVGQQHRGGSITGHRQ